MTEDSADPAPASPGTALMVVPPRPPPSLAGSALSGAAGAGGGAVHRHRVIHANALAIPSQMPALLKRDAAPMAVRDTAIRLGIDPVFDHDLLHLAEELLNAGLPPGWEKHTETASGRTYYHHVPEKHTQWVHPMEAYYSGMVFMLKSGDALMEEKALAHPPRPEETTEMAKYFGIDPKTEPALVAVAKAAVNAPLPPGWDEFEDEDGEVYFHHAGTGRTAHTHPLDGYFLELVRVRRKQLAAEPPFIDYTLRDYHRLDDTSPMGPEWLEYLDAATGAAYWYNHAENVTTYFPPFRVVKAYLHTAAIVKIQARMRGVLTRKRLGRPGGRRKK